jgi:hypothetical protein
VSLRTIYDEDITFTFQEIAEKHETLKEMQKFLNRANLYRFKPDGLWGPNTLASIENFCMREGLEKNFLDREIDRTFIKKLMSISTPEEKQQTIKQITDHLRKLGGASLNKNHLAYILATVQHETANTFLPISEFHGYRRHYAPYWGRGYVQLTHKANYEKYSVFLNVDMVEQPDLALQPTRASFILVHGMLIGAFTGKSLSDYDRNGSFDFINARRIINGRDCADKIAGYALKWRKTL